MDGLHINKLYLIDIVLNCNYYIGLIENSYVIAL